MKKFVIGAVTGVLLTSTIALAASYVAEPASFKVLVNGEEFNSDPPALVVEGRTYLPLRAIGDALGVPVEWNAELNQAEVGITSNIDAHEVANFLIGDVWNDGFWWVCNYLDGSYVYYMDQYIETFADSADEEFNIDKVIANILNSKSTIEMYNNSLKNNEKWVAFYNEYNRLYDIIESGSYTIENFDTTFFVKVRDEFCGSI